MLNFESNINLFLMHRAKNQFDSCLFLNEGQIEPILDIWNRNFG